ncbi:hypothetical protein EXW94_12405 [Enterobacter sp. JMULE2]|uniref:hypothetical protein n=1 Tax=Enterobacter sp. JMULE2 TaxID=2518340 RepID=UPI00067FD265|nr:hypothetical protein [Enterobacter sp. JMULE2]NTZ38530.1 hypothetical protein [Enterobacter sp. JMULE2]
MPDTEQSPREAGADARQPRVAYRPSRMPRVRSGTLNSALRQKEQDLAPLYWRWHCVQTQRVAEA